MAVATNRVGGPNRLRGLLSAENGNRERTIVAALLLLAIAYPFFSRYLPSALPFPSINNLIVMCYYAVLALGLNIVVGFAGLLDLGYVAFYVVGAYTTAFLASPQFDIHLSWWIVVWIAVLMAALAGILLGAPTLRLRGDYLAIVTLGFGEIMPLLVRNLDRVTIKIGDFFLVGPDADITGGPLGINPIDPPKIPIAGPWGNEMVFSNSNPQLSLYLILLILVGSYLVCRRLRDSRLGRAWMAIREDETAAASMGINTVNTKLLAFALGASFSGFVGAFVGAYQTAIFPESFNFSISISILIMIILGGIGSLRGVILGAFIIQYVNQALLGYLGGIVDDPIQGLGDAVGIPLLSNFTLTSINFLIYGVILVVMMIVRPEGLLPSAAAKAEMHGEGIAAEATLGTESEVATAATDFEESIGELPPIEPVPGESPPTDEGTPPGPARQDREETP